MSALVGEEFSRRLRRIVVEVEGEEMGSASHEEGAVVENELSDRGEAGEKSGAEWTEG